MADGTFDVNKLVDAALTHAAAYMTDSTKWGGLGLMHLTQEKRDEIIAERMATYASASMRPVFADIITHFANKDEIKNDGQFTYLSGANGAKQLLMEAVKDASNTTPHIDALREALAAGVQFDFQEAKRMFTEKTGKSLEGDKYAEFRAAFSGMDRAITNYARAQNLNRVSDSVVPVIPEGTPDHKVHVFAIALTPEQAKAQADKLGINADEAAKNAKRFAAFFAEARKGGADITLLDAKLNPIFVRNNGEVTVQNDVALAHWKGSINPPTLDTLPGQAAPRETAISTPAR